MGALSDPSLYSIVLLADRWSGPARALSPYRKQSPNSQCSFLASFWPKGGARWNALPARRARTQRTEYQASNRRSETKHHPVVYLAPFLARFLCLSLVLAFAGQEWDRSGGDRRRKRRWRITSNRRGERWRSRSRRLRRRGRGIHMLQHILNETKTVRPNIHAQLLFSLHGYMWLMNTLYRIFGGYPPAG